MNSGVKQLVFVIGGPYGFSQEVYNKALGTLTFENDIFSSNGTFIFY